MSEGFAHVDMLDGRGRRQQPRDRAAGRLHRPQHSVGRLCQCDRSYAVWRLASGPRRWSWAARCTVCAACCRSCWARRRRRFRTTARRKRRRRRKPSATSCWRSSRLRTGRTSTLPSAASSPRSTPRRSPTTRRDWSSTSARTTSCRPRRPPTANPSLWRQAQILTKHGLFKVADRIYQVRGFDVSTVSFIDAGAGWIVVDPLTTVEVARAALGTGAPSTSATKPVLRGHLFAQPRRPLRRRGRRHDRRTTSKAGR